MDNQTKYQPKAAGLNPKATFDPNQKSAGGGHKGGKANSTQNILQLAEIRDGLVIMNDGSFRMVVFCRPINFILMSEQEKSSIEYSYQGFLNSLFFPIQIMVRSRRVDAGHYIELLDKARQNQGNMLLEMVMGDYINFMSDLIAGTDIMDKFFYVVVPYNPVEEMSKDNIVKNTQGFFGKLFKFGQASSHLVIEESSLNDAKRELRRRIQAVIEGLQQCGVTGVPLDTEELIELYYESYNPDTSGGHQLAALKDLSTPMVTRSGEPSMPAVGPDPLPVAQLEPLPPPPTIAEAPTPDLPPPLPTAPAVGPPTPVTPPMEMPAPVTPVIEPPVMAPPIESLPLPTAPPIEPPLTAGQVVTPAPDQYPQPPVQATAIPGPSQWATPPTNADPQLGPYPPV